jgi:acetate kinase
MNKLLVTINAGSSNIKFACFQLDEVASLRELAHGQIELNHSPPSLTIIKTDGEVLVDAKINVDTSNLAHSIYIDAICSWLKQYSSSEGAIMAIGHRVVHGGVQYSEPTLINDEVLSNLKKLCPLAPLHQPQNLAAITALRESMPSVPQVACFDTAFHRNQPEVSQMFALPREWYEKGIRRYGFHGLSYEYVLGQLPKLNPTLQTARIIIAHLGNGASLCAIKDGKSVATTMGFSTLDGLVMGSRCGLLDPGVLLYLMDQHGMDFHTLQHLLYHESGLLGVSGLSADMRLLLASQEHHAKEAVELFVYRIVREIGSLSATLGGLDALVFTGGIGENSAEIRAAIIQQCLWFGLHLDEQANRNASQLISTPASSVSAHIVKTNENLMIALNTLKLIK